ncbi:MAG: ATP-dependent DNA helicase RecQ [Acidimicrobiales bacterium]|nr:ATP-dependent DNA helicase RecQ [Acidimicrobiales bacterium]
MTSSPQTADAVLEALAGPGAVLRDDQRAAIDALVERHERVLLVQATGWGKSAVYWVATALLRAAGGGPTLVVSPLLALMRNQVAAAERAGIRAATINSANLEEWAEIEARIAANEIDVLLISPERLNNPRFRREVLPSLAAEVGLLVIDEAHCISDWGHDFRPDYRRIADVLASLGSEVRVLAATATANRRVEHDVAAQIGTATRTFRGSLDRASLHLSVVELRSSAEQLAWLASWTAARPGPGLVYCLTVSEAERVAAYLADHGVAAASYTGSTPAPERERIEAGLGDGSLACVVATSALGMGYDNPNLAYVVHLGSPSSPIAYYQQVGRAGRGAVDAEVVLLPTVAEERIWAYFDATAMPPEAAVTEVLDVLAAHGPCTLPRLESMVNLRRGRLEALLKVLDVEGAADRDGSAWFRTAQPWTYDRERYAALGAARAAEQAAMRAYRMGAGCRLRYLREQLDDPGAADCGRCDRCTGSALVVEVSDDEVARARRHLRSVPVVVEPRKQWPKGLDGRRGNIALDRRAEEGRALALGTDPGWSEDLERRFAAADAPPDEELLRGVAAALKAWDWGRRPTWVTWVPSRRRPLLVEGLASEIARIGKMELVDAVRRIRTDAPPQSQMDNSVTQAANVADAFEFGALDGSPLPLGPGLVFDDTVRSGWTMTVVADGLRGAGSGLVLPFALWKRP